MEENVWEAQDEEKTQHLKGKKVLGVGVYLSLTISSQFTIAAKYQFFISF